MIDWNHENAPASAVNELLGRLVGRTGGIV